MENKLFKSKEESRKAYKEYVDEHIKAVQTCFKLYGMDIIYYIYENMDRFIIISNQQLYYFMERLIEDHDKSKFSAEEFDAYAAKFKRSEEDSQNDNEIEENFNKAWVHHYTNNKHHPEYWSSINKSITITAFIEMILDWIAMSYTFKSSLYEWWFNNPSGRE